MRRPAAQPSYEDARPRLMWRGEMPPSAGYVVNPSGAVLLMSLVSRTGIEPARVRDYGGIKA